MMRKPIELIATCDGAYLAPLRSAMASCVINNPGEKFCLHLLHASAIRKRCITVFLRPMCLRRLRGGPCTLTRTCW